MKIKNSLCAYLKIKKDKVNFTYFKMREKIHREYCYLHDKITYGDFEELPGRMDQTITAKNKGKA